MRLHFFFAFPSSLLHLVRRTGSCRQSDLLRVSLLSRELHALVAGVLHREGLMGLGWVQGRRTCRRSRHTPSFKACSGKACLIAPRPPLHGLNMRRRWRAWGWTGRCRPWLPRCLSRIRRTRAPPCIIRPEFVDLHRCLLVQCREPPAPATVL